MPDQQTSGKIVGYARVSKTDQSLKQQVAQLRALGCDEIYTDQMSGKTARRDGLQHEVAHVRLARLEAVIPERHSGVFEEQRPPHALPLGAGGVGVAVGGETAEHPETLGHPGAARAAALACARADGTEGAVPDVGDAAAVEEVGLAVVPAPSNQYHDQDQR